MMKHMSNNQIENQTSSYLVMGVESFPILSLCLFYSFFRLSQGLMKVSRKTSHIVVCVGHVGYHTFRAINKCGSRVSLKTRLLRVI